MRSLQPKQTGVYEGSSTVSLSIAQWTKQCPEVSQAPVGFRKYVLKGHVMSALLQHFRTTSSFGELVAWALTTPHVSLCSASKACLVGRTQFMHVLNPCCNI